MLKTLKPIAKFFNSVLNLSDGGGIMSDGESLTLWFASWQSEARMTLIKVKPVYVCFSRYQRIEVYDSSVFGRLLVLNGEIQLSSKFNAYIHESMVHPSLLLHPNPKDVLIVGGGDGGSTTEVVKHNVESVTVVEIDEEVVKTAKRYFPEISAGFSDPRVKLIFDDGRAFLEKCSQKFDVIINDMSDPVGPAKSVFTKEFFILVREHLSDGGIFTTHVESPDSCEEFFYRVLATMREVFPIVRPYRVWTPPYTDYWGRAIASIRYDPLKLASQEVEERVKRRGITLKWLTPELYHSIFRSLSRDVLEKMEMSWEPITETNFPEFKRT